MLDFEEVLRDVVGREAGIFSGVDDRRLGDRHCGIVEGFELSGMGSDTAQDKVVSAVVGLYENFSVSRGQDRDRSKTSVW